jgi:hypothetical protein
MKNNSKHITLIIFGVITIFASAFGYWYLHLAVMNQAQNYALALSDAQTYNENRKNEQNLQKIYRETTDSRVKISSYIISEDRVIDFIESIENIGKTTNTLISLSSINSTEMKGLTKGQFGHVKARVDIKGSWSGVMAAISMLENMPFSVSLDTGRLFNGINADLPASTKAAKSTSWNFSANINVLSVK